MPYIYLIQANLRVRQTKQKQKKKKTNNVSMMKRCDI